MEIPTLVYASETHVVTNVGAGYSLLKGHFC